jgi:uncharacterized protein (DUF1015 family)
VTEIRPFRGLRYDPSAARPDDVIAPPYDVVDAADVATLLGRSPYNIAHIESCERTDEGYAQAAALIERWETDGVLRRDEAPAYYAYEQRFQLLGATYTRRAFFTRMRIHPHEAGIVRPHEATLSGPKEDRLRLLRATKVNVSPIFGMFADPEASARAILNTVTAGPPAFEAKDGRGDEHRLWPIQDAAHIEALTAVVADSPVTIADGHHRYHTALNYLTEREAQGAVSEADRYILTGLVAQDEIGLVVLPIHRLIRDGSGEELRARLGKLYDIEAVEAPWDAEGAQQLWARVEAEVHSTVAFGVIGLDGQTFHLLRARSPEAVAGAMPAHLSPASRSLHVLVLNETILQPLLGLDATARAAGERIAFTEDVEGAWARVDSGGYQLAFLVEHVHVEQIVAVADAGEVLPQKSTFFYPKLATGMVLNPLD